MNRAEIRFSNAFRVLNLLGDRAEAALIARDPKAGRYWRGLTRASHRCDRLAARTR